MLEVLQMPFMQRALVSAVLVGCLASFFSVFVVQRKMSFLGSGLAHATFGGIALGLLLGLKPLLVALPFTLGVAILIEILRKRSKLHADTLIGVFFSVSMALGIVLLSLKREYSPEAMSFLFGSILSIDLPDVWMACGLFLLCLGLLPLWKNWSYASFDPELAMADGIRVGRDNFILVILMALTVVIASKILGIILMAASLVIPGASARLISQSFSSMTFAAICFGVIASLLGLLLSYLLDIPSGATIVLVQSGIFFLCFLAKLSFIRPDK